jgi:hypothetical protein
MKPRYSSTDYRIFELHGDQVSQSGDDWCIFDHTADGSAFENAWELQELIAVCEKVTPLRAELPRLIPDLNLSQVGI